MAPPLVPGVEDAALIGGRYELRDVVGRGGHSVVYRALDRETGQEVAVKMLHDSVAADPEHTVRMVREQRASAALQGTAAVQVLGMTASAEGALCLVMELLTGMDLDDLLERIEARGERLGVPALIEILTPVVETLDAAHAAGIVHRDLKPGNVFILDGTRGTGVRLLDFGLAKLAASKPLTRDGMVLGSPSYIAPEVWAADRESQDHRVDVYAFGAIVFRALSGQVPFVGSSLREKMELVKAAPRPSLREARPELPPAVDVWVRQALAVRPDDRFFRVSAMWNAFLDAVGRPAVGRRSSA